MIDLLPISDSLRLLDSLKPKYVACVQIYNVYQGISLIRCKIAWVFRYVGHGYSCHANVHLICAI